MGSVFLFDNFEIETNVPKLNSNAVGSSKRNKPRFPIKSVDGLSEIEKGMEADEEFRSAVVRMLSGIAEESQFLHFRSKR